MSTPENLQRLPHLSKWPLIRNQLFKCVWRLPPTTSKPHPCITPPLLPRGTHYCAESLSWYSLERLKQSCTPGSIHSRLMAARRPGLKGSVSACLAVIPNNNMASSCKRAEGEGQVSVLRTEGCMDTTERNITEGTKECFSNKSIKKKLIIIIIFLIVLDQQARLFPFMAQTKCYWFETNRHTLEAP